MAQEITAHDFEAQVINSKQPVVIDFYAEWCGPCKMMAPHFAELSKKLSDQYKLVKVNIDENRDLAISHNIASIPTLVFYKDGSIVGVESGYLDQNGIQAKIAKYFGS